jgi:uncharacterized protein DUF2630
MQATSVAVPSRMEGESGVSKRWPLSPGCFGRDSGRCWDLLRRRRAIGGAGGDPGRADVRDARTVERYLQ